MVEKNECLPLILKFILAKFILAVVGQHKSIDNGSLFWSPEMGHKIIEKNLQLFWKSLNLAVKNSKLFNLDLSQSNHV